MPSITSACSTSSCGVAPESLASTDGASPRGVGASRSPFSWPLLTITSDQCSEVVSVVGWLLRGPAEANCEAAWDLSHGVWNDTKSAIKASRLWPFFTTFLLHRNCRHGPWAEEKRYQQCIEGLSSFLAIEDSTSPWFRMNVEKILRDKGFAPPHSDERIAEEWSAFTSGEAWVSKGTPVKLNRFMQGLREAVKEDRWWHSRLVVQAYVCLQLGYLSTKKVQNFLHKRLAGQRVKMTEDGDGSTSMRAVGPEELSLKQVSSNMLSLSTLFLDDDENQTILRLLVVVTREADRWHGMSNTQCRDVDKNAAFMYEMVAGGFQKHLASFWRPLDSR